MTSCFMFLFPGFKPYRWPLFLPLFLLFFFGFFSPAFSQKKSLYFNHITSKDGLSQNHGLCIIQDYKGFMWFGTEGGLNKYDGYKITIYRSDSEDSLSLSSDLIYDILEDRDKNLWVCTNNGLNLYNRKLDNFFRFQHEPDDPHSISDNVAEKLFQDKEGRIWIGARNGLNLYNNEEKNFTRYDANGTRGRINAIYEDSQENLWLGAEKGLFLFDREKETFKQYGQQNVSAILEDGQGNLLVGLRYDGLGIFDLEKRSFTRKFTHNPENENSIGNNVIFKLFKDRKGNIWVGTENGGLNLYDPKKESFNRYVHNSFDSRSISNNTVSAIYEDISGILWVGVHRGGINYYDPSLERFQTYQKQAGQSSISHNNIKSFAEDKNGNIWIGTDGGGLNFWDRKKDNFTHYRHEIKNSNSISNDVVVSVLIDKDDNVWASTFQGGLNKYEVNKNKFTSYKHDPADSNSIGSDFVWCALEDRNGDLWFSARGAGLSLLNKKTNSFTTYSAEEGKENTLSSNYINVLFEDSKGNFWIGTNLGLNLFNRDNKLVIAEFTKKENEANSISDGDITAIFEDHKNNIWIGTRNGLNLYDPETRSFKVYNRKDGLLSPFIVSIQEDSEGNLWLGTQMGLTKFNPEENTFKTYTSLDGLQGDEFSLNASFRTRNGEMIFGGNNGFNVFHPNEIKDNEYIPPVSVTDFLIFNKSIKPGRSPHLKENITETRDITLSYRESVFSFEFAAQNFSFSEKNQYAYMMEGFDKDWNYVGSMRTASYTNLDPGAYTFRVKASNNDGKWNEKGTSLALIITPPYWKTWWFRVLLAASVFGGALTFYKVRMNGIKAQKVELEKQVKERTAEVVIQKEELESQAENLQLANSALQKTQEEILQQRAQIEGQHHILEIANTKVMDSINYAKSIQKAILPSSEKIGGVFPEHFILFRPKDIVSGDFYWFTHLSAAETNGKSAADLSFIAVIDCTGHGVPGAFMSIIGHNLLHEIINLRNILDPAQVLEELDKGVMRSVEKTEGVNTAGMDICLLKIEKEVGEQVRISFSGGKRPLYFVKKGSEEIETLEADRRSIGAFKFDRPFTNQELIVEKGTTFYLLTDGYVDQNNPERIKIGTQKLRECIRQAVAYPMEEQGKIYEDLLDAHQEDAEQRDDITLIGFKV